MGSWEDELDLDLSDIWAAGTKPDQGAAAGGRGGAAQYDAGDDLAFPSQAGARVAGPQSHNSEPGARVSRAEPQNETTPFLDADVADATTQVASLSAEPYVARGGSDGGSKLGLAPLPSFQAVAIATQQLASRESEAKQRAGLRNPNGRGKGTQQAGGDIRRYFSQGGPSSGGDGGGGGRKKARIPGPVGDLLQREQRDEGDGVHRRVSGAGDDDGSGRVFRKGAWMSALQSLDVEEFDPARYAILKVTASSIGSSRRQQRVPHFVAVIKELTPNVFGDAAVILKDPTGTVAGMMNNKVFSNTDYARAISPGAVIVLKQVAVFSPSAHYLNITINNVVQVFPANTDLPQGSAPNPQVKQEPLAQKEEPPQPRPQPQPSPPQKEQPPTQLLPQPSPLQPPQPRPKPSPSPLQQAQQPTQHQSQPRPSPSPTKAPNGIAKTASWDLLPPSPSPQESSPPQEPKAPEGVAAAAKMAGWGDLTDDMEALLNEDVDDFYK